MYVYMYIYIYIYIYTSILFEDFVYEARDDHGGSNAKASPKDFTSNIPKSRSEELNVYVCMYVCMHLCVYAPSVSVCIHVYIHHLFRYVRIHVCMLSLIHIIHHVFVYKQTKTDAFMCICICLGMSAHIYVCSS